MNYPYYLSYKKVVSHTWLEKYNCRFKFRNFGPIQVQILYLREKVKFKIAVTCESTLPYYSTKEKLLIKKFQKEIIWNKTIIICKEVDEMSPCTDEKYSS